MTEQYPMGYLKELYRANDLILMGVADEDVEMAMEILYDARGQGHLDYSNQVQHDLYGTGEGGG